MHTAQPTRFSRTGSVSPGEAGSHMPLQGAGKGEEKGFSRVGQSDQLAQRNEMWESTVCEEY